MKNLLLALVFISLLTSPLALAQESEGEKPSGEQMPSAEEGQEVKVVKPHASFGFFGGAHVMRDENWEKIYGNAPVLFLGFSIGYKIVADLEIWGEVGYSVDEGKGITLEGEKTAERFRMHVVPSSLGLLYRLKFFENQLVVPFLGGAVHYYYFYEGRLESDEKIDGGKWGYSGFAGLQLLLDNADPRAASSMKTEYGIDNTYLFYEFRYTVVDDWGEKEGLDLSSMMHIGGLLFEF